jgi:hypothetical protein
MKTEIMKPCPHCGAHAILHNCVGDYWVDCSRKCQKLSSSVEQAIAEWNCRNEGVDYVKAETPAPVAEAERCCENREGEIMNYSKIVEEIEESLKGEVIFDNAEKVEIESILRKYLEGGLSPSPVDEVCECGHSKIGHDFSVELDKNYNPCFNNSCSCMIFTPRKVVEPHKGYSVYDRGRSPDLFNMTEAIQDIHKRLLKLEGK